MTKPDLTGDRRSLISDNLELDEAIKRGIQSLPYPEVLAEISNTKRQIAITGSHGKSTTTSMIGIMLSRSTLGGSTIVGTKLTEF